MNPKEQKDQSQPGRTPGKAEGKEDPSATGQGLSSEPGPTPGSAEGDRETVEESLREKEPRGR